MLSRFDIEHIHDIMAGHGDWFSAQLLRLIAHADLSNRNRLRGSFPNHVALYEWWYNHAHSAESPLHLAEEGVPAS